MDEHVAAQEGDDDECDGSAVDQGQPHDECDQESAQRRDEPAGDDGHDARNAVYGAFAAPCAVGERRTHGHHEADVSRREGQFERRGDGDQHGRGREVYRGADHVVRRAAVFDVLVFEAARNGGPHARRDDPFDAGVDVECRADDRAREDRRTVLLGAFVTLRRERQLGFGDVHGLFRGPEREYHDGACGQQDQEVGRNVVVQHAHQHLGIAAVPGDRVGVESGDGYADEVHQVVAREGQRQGEGARKDGDAQDVDLEPLYEEEQQRADDPADQERQQQVIVHHRDEIVSRQNGFKPFEDGEVDDRRQRGAAPHRPEAAERKRVAEREDRARDVHDEGSAGEGDDHRQEDRRDDAHGAGGVDELSQRADAEVGGVRDFVDRHGDGRSEQAEDQRYGGRGRQSPRIVEVQQDDVGEHHAQIEHHHFVEGEESGIEHAAAGDLHHAARRYYADDDADRGDEQDGAHGCGFGADGGVEEIDCVVGDADKKTGYGENAQNAYNDSVDFTHVRV